MILPKCVLLFGLILTLLLDPISGKRGLSGGHSYPKSGGLSGGGHRTGGLSGGSHSGGHHSYPSSGGSHSYPSSGGSHSHPSSGGSHSYPSSGGSHSYPSSGGSHSYPSSGGSHSYPSSGGSHSYPSSGGSHSYPSSGGSHTYPSSGGSHSYPSPGGSNSYPSSGGSHSYPSSGGSHSYPSSGGSHSYPSSSGSSYPSSNGKSGGSNTHAYPAGPGLSGGGHSSHSSHGKHTYPTQKPVVHHKTYVYNNYRYRPPTQISYTPYRGAPAQQYPVYTGQPPTYVFKYKESGSKYGTLLAGLALMNLGTLGVAGYALHKANQNHNSNQYHGGTAQPYTYTPQKGEVCKFAVKKENGDYEETRIDCQIISGFILQDMEAQKAANNQSTVTTTTTVTNVTMVNTTNVGGDQGTTVPPAIPSVLYTMMPNGTLVPINMTGLNITTIGNVNQNVTAPANNQSSSSSVVTTTTTTTNTTLVSALDVKGEPVAVTPGMQCFVMRQSPISNMKKSVPCGLLQTYADTSISPNSAARNVPMFTIMAAVLAYCIA